MDNVEPKIKQIAFFGPMCSGKTFLAKYLVDEYGYQKIAFADKLKELSTDLFKIEGKDSNTRHIYQQLGESLRSIDDRVWINAVDAKITQRYNLYGDDCLIVIDDVRYQNEYEYLSLLGFTLIRACVDEPTRLNRIQSLYPGTTIERINHISETDLNLKSGDYQIISSGPAAISDLEAIIWKTS